MVVVLLLLAAHIGWRKRAHEEDRLSNVYKLRASDRDATRRTRLMKKNSKNSGGKIDKPNGKKHGIDSNEHTNEQKME